MREAYRAFERCEAQGYLEQSKRGESLVYALSAKGREVLARHKPSPQSRKRRWDGRWRMVMFDFPESARKARDAFRHLLRQQRMGCLQKSVWICPDPVLAEWRELLKGNELNQWVLLFESAELGPVSDAEIARRVWPLDKLQARYERYLDEFGTLGKELRASRHSTLAGALGERVGRESKAYLELIGEDPILPQSLAPANFVGPKADSLHVNIRGALRECLFGKG